MDLKFRKDGFLVPRKEPYELTLSQVRFVYGHQSHNRRNIYDCLERGVSNLFEAGVERVILGGSFITKKESPSDADACWYWHEGVDVNILDEVFLQEKRAALGKFLMDVKMDFIWKLGDLDTHEVFLTTNARLVRDQEIGIVRIVKED